MEQKLVRNADFWQFADEHLQSPTTFRGVSFISSIKFIERYLLPRYQSVTLVLGLSDNGTASIGQRLTQLTERNEFVKYGYEHRDSEFTKRLLDGILKLYFTKKELIHTKLYLITNDRDYVSFAGSMNLTEAALHHNLEQLDSDYGQQTAPLYQCHQQMFEDNLAHAATYLDSKKMMIMTLLILFYQDLKMIQMIQFYQDLIILKIMRKMIWYYQDLKKLILYQNLILIIKKNHHLIILKTRIRILITININKVIKIHMMNMLLQIQEI